MENNTLTPSSPLETPSDQPLILLVDDFEDTRTLYAEFLDMYGFRVAEAGDGLEALEKAFALLPAVIVMDLTLPGLDGWSVTRRLKQDQRTSGIPVIAVSGHSAATQQNEAKEAGCDGYVTKPCLPEDLLNAIRSFLA